MKTFKFAIMCAAAIALVACKPNNPVEENCEVCGENPCVCVEDPGFVSMISVTDNSLADWDNLPAEYLVVTTHDEGCSKDGLKSVKVFADEVYINLLVEYNTEVVTDLSSVPFHLYLDCDNSAETGGGVSQWVEPQTEILLEGWFYADGEPCEYIPELFAWSGAVGVNDWAWEGLTAAAVFSASQVVDGKVEIQLLHELIPGTWNETSFNVGFDIQRDWNSVGYLPNAADDELGNSVLASLLNVKFYRGE